MYSHILVGSNDIARSKKFYDALFTAIGGQPGAEMRPGRIAYTHNGARFVVTVPNDGKPATAANGGTIGFNIGDPKLAEAWHKAGVANGGTSIEDPPGVRPNGAYLAGFTHQRLKVEHYVRSGNFKAPPTRRGAAVSNPKRIIVKRV